MIGMTLARAMNRLEWVGMNGREEELRRALADHSAKYVAAQGMGRVLRVTDMEWVPTSEDQGLLLWFVFVDGAHAIADGNVRS